MRKRYQPWRPLDRFLLPPAPQDRLHEKPHFTTIARFGRIHLDALCGLFIQTVHTCRDAGLLRGERVALGGTKVQANASKRKAMSFGRVKKKLSELEEEVAGWRAETEAVDRAEDELYGVGKSESDREVAEGAVAQPLRGRRPSTPR